MDRDAWIRAHVEPAGAIETEQEKPWATVLRVPVAAGRVWFKACAPVQAFEPRLTAALAARWPGRVADVLAHDERRAWLLMADAGTPIGAWGNPIEAWVEVLPRYAELQRGEVARAPEHLAQDVPDLRLAALPALYERLLASRLPLESAAIERLISFAPAFARLCEQLAAVGIGETLQHDDLHAANVYEGGGALRVLDWGDASIGHPFTTLFVTFRHLERAGALSPGVRERLRDAYLEVWGPGLEEVFALALRVAAFAHAFTWQRHREHLPAEMRESFDGHFAELLHGAVAASVATPG